MNLHRAKIGTLLSIGIVSIIGLMISATVYSSYLSNKAQHIIESSTSRIFDVLTIQRDTEELFSALADLEIVQNQHRLDAKKEDIKRLFDRARNTIQKGKEREIFSEEDSSKSIETLNKVLSISTEIFKLKEESISGTIDKGDKNSNNFNRFSKVSNEFNNLRNVRFEMMSVVNDIITQSDEEFRNAMILVHTAQIVTWIVVGVSSILAMLLAYYLVRSAKKIYDLKNEFINIIAHDLRNPVVGIIGALDLISTQKDKVSAEMKEYLQAVEVSAHKLRSQISNLLEVGRTEAGHIKLNMTPVLVFEVIGESILRAKALAETSGIKLVDNKTDGKSIFVSADRSKLSDVLDNLISNAIKYNKEKGTVTISTKEEGNLLNISISDTGHGIPKDQEDKIFKKYSRLEQESEKSVGGTGLGLYTVKLSMDKMKGHVGFKTKVGEGTTFTVSLKKTEKTKTK